MSNKKLLPTFKDWKALHENFGGPIPLGVTTPHSLGAIGSVTTSLSSSSNLEDSLDELDIQSLERLEEAVKKVKGKKKMLLDLGKKPKLDEPVDDDDDDDDDDEGSCHKEPDLDDEDDVDDVEVDIDDKDEIDVEKKIGGLKKPELLLSKKKAKKAKKMAAEATEETEDWWSSVRSQMAGEVTQRWDGVEMQPGPGEVGFAPQTRVGWFQ